MSIISKGEEFSIVGLVGEPGVGKSCVCQQLVDLWAKDRNVWSTKEFKGAYKITKEDLKTYDFFANGKQGGVLILDEAGIDFNSRDFKALDKDILEFFKYYRHFKLDIFIVSQGIDTDLAIRRLVNRWYKLCRVVIPIVKIKTNFVQLVAVDQNLLIENGDWKLVYTAGKVEKVFNISKSFGSFDSFAIPEGRKNINLHKWGEDFTSNNTKEEVKTDVFYNTKSNQWDWAKKINIIK